MSMLRSRITDLDHNTVLKSVRDLKEIQKGDIDKNGETQISVEMVESVYRENRPMGINITGAGTKSELMILIK